MVLPADQETYTDHLGVVRRTPRTIGRLKMQSVQGRAMRAFVFARDGFTCQKCGTKPEALPVEYDGADGVELPKRKRDVVGWLVLDHIVSRMNGGTHHPSNLQTLCDGCNSVKVGKDDARHPNAVKGRRLADQLRADCQAREQRRRRHG